MFLCFLSSFVFSPDTSGAYAPKGAGRKTKTLCRAKPTQRKKQSSYATRAQGQKRQNRPLQKRTSCRIMYKAVRPFGRCVGGCVTCIGLRVLAHPQAAAFLFFMSIIAGTDWDCKGFLQGHTALSCIRQGF